MTEPALGLKLFKVGHGDAVIQGVRMKVPPGIMPGKGLCPKTGHVRKQHAGSLRVAKGKAA